MSDEIGALKANINELNAEVVRLRKLATDRLYFMVAYRNMLGPVALSVLKMWAEKGVQRVHFSWGPDAGSMSGEERAQFILDLEEKMKDAVLVEDIDSDLSPSEGIPR